MQEGDCNSEELIAAFEARREVTGDPEEKMTDAQAETFYYGAATGRVVTNEAAHSVSDGRPRNGAMGTAAARKKDVANERCSDAGG